MAVDGKSSRRGFLLGGLGLVGVGTAAVVVERGPLADRIRPAGTLVSGTLVSEHRLGAVCGWTVCYPPGSTPTSALPVVVALHGRGGDHRSSFGSGLRLNHYLARAVAAGVPRFAVASVDGGNTYWHKRASGEDAGAMVLTEFLPLLARRGLLTARLGLLGYSMGGYGALLLGGELGSRGVRAVAASSPALWRRAADTAPGAYDDPADFAAFTVFGRQRQLDGIAMHVDCGTSDGFFPVTKAYVDSLSPRPDGGFEAGGHDSAYWRRMAPLQLAFLGTHL